MEKHPLAEAGEESFQVAKTNLSSLEKWQKKQSSQTSATPNQILGSQLLRLATHSQTPIVRHIKVQGSRSPFDGDWSYWAKRMGKHPELPNYIARLLKQQGGKCSYCGLYFESSNLLEVHHLDGNCQNHRRNNLALLHQHCHDQVHQGVYDKHQIVEKLDESKGCAIR